MLEIKEYFQNIQSNMVYWGALSNIALNIVPILENGFWFQIALNLIGYGWLGSMQLELYETF